MTIERLLKAKAFFPLRGYTEISVHCSCGIDYMIKEEFNLDTEWIYPSKCPKCKEISYIKVNPGTVEIVTDEILNKD